MATALQTVINAPLSNRLKEALEIAPRLLDAYFSLAVHDANDCTCSMGECFFPYWIKLICLNYETFTIWEKDDFSGCWLWYVYVSALICALIPLIMARYSTLFPDKIFCYEVRYSTLIPDNVICLFMPMTGTLSGNIIYPWNSIWINWMMHIMHICRFKRGS